MGLFLIFGVIKMYNRLIWEHPEFKFDCPRFFSKAVLVDPNYRGGIGLNGKEEMPACYREDSSIIPCNVSDFKKNYG